MAAFRGIVDTVGELIQSLWAHRLWWLVPVVVVLLVFAVLTILGSTMGVGPFIYTLF